MSWGYGIFWLPGSSSPKVFDTMLPHQLETDNIPRPRPTNLRSEDWRRRILRARARLACFLLAAIPQHPLEGAPR